MVRVTRPLAADPGVRDSEERLRGLIAASPNAFLVVNADGRILSADGRVAEILRYRPEDLVGTSVDRLVPDGLRPGHAELRAGYLADARTRPMALHRSLSARRSDGTEVPVDISLSPVNIGGAMHVLATIGDATESRVVEATLRESERNLAEAQRIAHVGSWSWEAATQVVTWSAEMYRIFGRDPAGPAVRLGEMGALFAGASSAAWTETLESALRTGDPWALDVRILRPDGTVQWASTRGIPERGLNGDVTHIRGTVLDISDRVAAEAAMVRADDDRKRSMNLLNAVIDGTSDHIAIKDLAGRYVLVNRADAEWFGLPAAEIIGRTDDELVDPNEAVAIRARDDIVTRSGRPFAYEQTADRDGVRRWWFSTKDVIRDEAGHITGLFTISREITELKWAQEQALQAQKMEAIGKLAGGIAHDFNNMLTAIRGYTELVQRRLPPDETQGRDDLGQVMLAADKAAELTRQLLAFSRKQVLAPRLVDPNEIVAGIAPFLGRLLGEHISVIVSATPGIGVIRVDPAQFEQVILNLAVNARDAMPDGGRLTIETGRVDLDAAYVRDHPGTSPGPHVLLAVSDTGSGMDVETQAHVFEPFFTTKPVGHGTGMGLATVYGIVQQSGGSIFLYSEPGHGSTFKLAFPWAGDGATTPVATVPPSSVPVGTETILLVEDAPAVRAFACRTLVDLGYTVMEAGDGAEALALAATHSGAIDLLVTDVVMPGIQGPELALQLAASRPGLPTLYVSGFTEHAAIRDGVVGRGDVYLAKPFSAAAFGRAVRAALAGPAGRP